MEITRDALQAGKRNTFLAELSRPTTTSEFRSYQEDARRAVWQSLLPGSRTLLHIATGGGKTLIANDVVARWLRERRGDVIWITKDWRLLAQSAADLCRRHGLRSSIGRLGGSGRVLDALPEVRARVRYTTAQTLLNRIYPGAGTFDGTSLLVWDECHHGENAQTGTAILGATQGKAMAVLGLTATPRAPARSAYTCAYSRTFSELVADGHLAHPLPEEVVETGYAWNARCNFDSGDFTKRSLEELAQSHERNLLIVRRYVEGARRYGKTIVFACTIEHATQLARMLNQHAGGGVAARAIHSGNREEENLAYLQEFRTGRAKVLVNVEMLTHGVDVPDAQTVFLTRPTMSDILYSQMIGRASRVDRPSGKTTFRIVEFTDNLDRFKADLMTAKRFFQGAGMGTPEVPASPAPRSREDKGRSTAHRFDPDGAPTWIPHTADVPEAMRGLWYRKGQTFGFEIELTDPETSPESLQGTSEWRERASAILAALRARLGPNRVARSFYEDYRGQGGEKSYDVWNLEYDSSAGWEVTSRILADEAGYAEVVDAAAAIEEAAKHLDLEVNLRTGLHVHLGWRPRGLRELRNLLRLVRIFEPALASLVPPSRVVAVRRDGYDPSKPCSYSKPLASAIGGAQLGLSFDRETLAHCFARPGSRYVTLNPRPLTQGGSTVEVRMHSGTLDPKKMLLWLSLWQQIVWGAGAVTELPDVADVDVLTPRSDIVGLARRYLPSANQPEQHEFLRRLAARRREIVAIWKGHPSLTAWLDFAEQWNV